MELRFIAMGWKFFRNIFRKNKMFNNEKKTEAPQVTETPPQDKDNQLNNAKELPEVFAGETPSPEQPTQKQIFEELQTLRLANDQLLQQLNTVIDENKKLLQQYGSVLVKEQNKHIDAEVQKLEQYLSTLTQNNELVVERMRTISEDNKKYNLDLVEAFKTQLVKAVWEYIFKTESAISNIINELDKEPSDNMFDKLKNASRNSTNDLKTILDTQFDIVTFCDENGKRIEVGKHRVVDHKTTGNEEQNGTIAETIRHGVRYIDNGKILYPQWVCGYEFLQPTATQPESESTLTSNEEIQ